MGQNTYIFDQLIVSHDKSPLRFSDVKLSVKKSKNSNVDQVVHKFTVFILLNVVSHGINISYL